MAQYEKRESGLWSVRFQIPGGKRLRLSGYRTKKEAQIAYEDYIANKQTAETQTPQKTQKNALSVDELVRLYLDYEKGRVKETTIYDVKSVIDQRILPYFTGMKVSEITPYTVLDWQNKLLEKYKFVTVKTAVSRLNSIFRYGERYHDIMNVMSKVERPRRTDPKREMQVWSPQEFRAFWNELDREDAKALFLTLYLCGCRKGEAYALTWDDINFEKGKIRINKAYNKKLPKDKRITSTKTESSVRTVAVPKFLCKYLKDYKAKQEAAGIRGQYVFGGETPITDTTANRAFKEAIHRSGVKDIRMHDLRHSCATYLISQGINIVAVSKRLGHATVEQTLNTYAHLFEEDNEKIIDLLDDLSFIQKKSGK